MIKLTRIFAFTIILLITISIFTENSPNITSSAESLKLGSSGIQVEELQQKLFNWGFYKGDINGNYDKLTFEAVKKYQTAHNLNVNGIAEKRTLISMGLTKTVQSGVAYAEGNGIGDEQLLARAINGEARGEPYEGQVAVGAVIINRTRDSRFPKTIAGVIYQPGAFTAVSDGQINVPIDKSSTVVKAARDALNGWDPSNGAVYYWNPATATSRWIWSRQIVKKIGNHYFGK